ncbi:EAL domain-containing protein [Paenisporosarcina quisquiliarum]|uniref:bifunctional diguanylate cyclase/phosphodiesterase n=1 Tax=Paenisporosarcina quisquiliarum TaxID=365346 RepID=UPI003737024A
MSKRQIQAYVLLSLILLTVVALTIINYQDTKQYVIETVDNETNELLKNFTDETNKFSNERVAELELIANYLVLLDGTDEEIIAFLADQRDKMPFFTSLGFINPEGETLAGDGSRFKVNQIESFERALQGEVVFSDLFPLYQDPDQIVTAIRLPVKKGDEVIGVLSGVVNMGNILGSVAKESSLPGSLYLFKEEQLVFSTTDEPFDNRFNYAADIKEQMKVKESGSILVEEDSAHFVMFQRAGADWTVLVDSYTNALDNRISTIFWRNTLVVAVTFLILCGILFYIRRNEVREDNLLKRDLLTNLPNRVVLEEKLKRDLDPTNFKNFTLFFVNLDRFKEINERNGYQIGDRVLFEVSNKIQEFANRNDLYRVGGDEFVLLVSTQDEEELKTMTTALVKLMGEPLELSTFESIWMTLSLGIRKSELGDWPDLMMQDATFAVQEAKKLGGNRAVFFSQELANQNERARLIANNVVHALHNNEYYMVYQPVYELSTQKIKSFEALLRWESPLIGAVSPIEFIPLLEDNDLIVPVGRWIIRQVALQVKQWENELHDGFHVAINISVKQMMHPDFMNDMKSIIQEVGISPSSLMFEITETVAVQNSELASVLLTELNEYGVQTALDDFGTGYSSLSILKLLPIQHVKVDRSFLMTMENEGEKSQIILQGILDIAKNLGMTTVMEGVETEEQLFLLKEMGAHKIQGFLISRPMVAELAIKLIDQKWTY